MPASLLSRHSLETLAAFVSGNVLLAFDFDGVLAPIVQVRERAHLRARTRALLIRVAESCPTIVVSGRQLSDLAPRLEGVPLQMVFGNFGYEPPPVDHPPPRVVAGWVADLERRFSGEEGVVVEDKRFSVAVHYRHSPHPIHAHRIIERELATIRGARVLQGAMAVMLVPTGGPTKGSTLQAARRRLGCDRAVYVGDDGTDEDAFESAGPERLLSVKVGPGLTQARFRLDNQAQIDRLLVRILASRRPAITRLRSRL
ncbi:MAG: trehalose-phosphatase [Vicinamibacterales bacterium]